MKKFFLNRIRIVQVFSFLLLAEMIVFVKNLENNQRMDEQFLLGLMALTFVMLFYVLFRFMMKRSYSGWFRLN